MGSISCRDLARIYGSEGALAPSFQIVANGLESACADLEEHAQT
jgi:hypothetical protein